MKPIPLAAYLPDFVPPVTGFNGSPAPVANMYDSNGIFQARGRSNSVKRKRTEEIDLVFDHSVEYPPLSQPDRPVFDLMKVKGLMVAAGSAAEDIRPLIDDPDTDPKLKNLGKLTLTILDALGAVIECGLAPLSGAAASKAAGGAVNGGAKAPPISAKPAPTPGQRELKESLEKADRESIMFEVDLGKNTLANRSALAAAFSNTVRKAAIDIATASGKDPTEAVRVMDDTLSIVSDMEFIGSSSQRFISKKANDIRSNTFCTMPVKFKFEDRNSRIHFEKSMRDHCNFRAGISLPKPVRLEQAAFLSALKERYPQDAITVRPDIRSASLYALRKVGGEGAWVGCPERLSLSPSIMLPNFVPRKSMTLTPLINEKCSIDGEASQDALETALVPMNS
jgi:hypothetical protein